MLSTDMNPGRYDDLCTYVREKAKAAGAIVIVIGGSKGQGFSVQLPAGALAVLPGILRSVADDIERDYKAIGQG